jgi:hypothetical protein
VHMSVRDDLRTIQAMQTRPSSDQNHPPAMIFEAACCPTCIGEAQVHGKCAVWLRWPFLFSFLFCLSYPRNSCQPFQELTIFSCFYFYQFWSFFFWLLFILFLLLFEVFCFQFQLFSWCIYFFNFIPYHFILLILYSILVLVLLIADFFLSLSWFIYFLILSLNI